MELQKFYQAKEKRIIAQIKRKRGLAQGFVAGEIISFLTIIAAVTMITVTTSDVGRLAEVLIAVSSLIAYIVIRQKDSKNDEIISHLEDLSKVYQNELQGLAEDFSCFDEGQRYVNPHHAYSYDLDIFGLESLFQRMSRLVTTGGSDAMANLLCSLEKDNNNLPDSTTINNGHTEIESLANNEKLRDEWLAFGVREKIDTEAIRKTLFDTRDIKLPSWWGSQTVLILALAELGAFFISILLAAMNKVSGMLPLWWGTALFFVVYLLCQNPLRSIGKGVGSLKGQLKRFVGVVKLINDEKAEVFIRMEQLIDGLDKRGNILGLLTMDTFALSDFFLVRKFIRWQTEDADKVNDWIDRIIAMDQKITIATFLFNHPDTCWAELTDDNNVTLEAHGLYHPFLGQKAVRNDFCIANRNFYIITGANMAGKSTFLRAIGVNYILARLNMPVFATSMRASRVSLFSSMRTTDDLAHGISYFNAELLRLKQLIISCKQNNHTLIILDEILKGTNSIDKLNGSRLFLEYISDLPVTGIVATHDLELSKLTGAQYHNYCFEIELGSDVTYSYKITPGVAENQNATFLLQKILQEN